MLGKGDHLTIGEDYEIIDYVKIIIGKYKAPKSISFVPDIPLTSVVR